MELIEESTRSWMSILIYDKRTICSGCNQNYDVDFICNECVSWSIHEIQFVLGAEFIIVT